MPSVQQTAALRGLRPVANALGWLVGLMYSRGIGWWARLDSSRTIAYSIGCSASVTGRARIARSASLSAFQYAKALAPSASSRPITSPRCPNRLPAPMMIAESSPSSTAVFSPL